MIVSNAIAMQERAAFADELEHTGDVLDAKLGRGRDDE